MPDIKKWLGKLSDMPISRKIMILVSCSVTFFTVGLSLMTYQRMAAALEEESSSKMYEVLKQINLNIIHNVEQQQRQMGNFLVSLDMANITAGGDIAHLDATGMKNAVVSLKAENDSFIDARLFVDGASGESSVVFHKALLASHPDTGRLSEQPFVWTNASDQSWNKFAYLPAIYCYANAVEQGGIWRFDISADKMFQSVGTSNFGSEGTMMVVKENGSLVYYSLGTEVASNHREVLRGIAAVDSPAGYFHLTINGREYFVSYTRENTLGWYIIGAVPRQEVQESARQIRNDIAVLSLMFSVLLILFLNLILRLFTNRTKKLSETIQQFGEGHFEAQFKSGGSKDEIGILGEQFNEMRGSIVNLMEESKAHYERENTLLSENLTLEIMRKEAEYHALQNQINPHFLYNTLEMIKGLFYEEGARDKIIDVVQALSDMFRYNLGASTTATLGEEIGHIQDYMFIQNTRFENQIQLEIDVEQALYEKQVLRFVFEPLVENSIKHGFAHRQGDKIIQIRAEETDEWLVLSVTDNGKGIAAEALEKLNEQLRTDTRIQREHGGIGVYNVNARLKKEYGGTFGLRFSSRPEQGTTVWMLIPKSDAAALGGKDDEGRRI